MRAGLLTEAIHIFRLQRTVDETGGEKREYVATHKLKAYRKKLSAAVGSGINASEEFIGSTLVFQVRKYAFLNEDIRVKYGSNFYKVILLDPQADNTYLLTCSKINE